MKKSAFLSKSLLALLLIALTETAFAGFLPPTTGLPEPGIFELLAIGGFGAALLALKSRKR